ncbi:hypothetical protein B9479_001885 [Cryptococcus floricola]|uniref:Fork-head domain-containing protein n=1 Tax=Cryptococcus floricola TaxID=2591691 RepID=A0A5D3B4Y4_9TREE|nr:hypothetical protein B9479_001885 [Cryptococcus floricola]
MPAAPLSMPLPLRAVHPPPTALPLQRSVPSDDAYRPPPYIPRVRATGSRSSRASPAGAGLGEDMPIAIDRGVEGIPPGPRPVHRPNAPLVYIMGQAILASTLKGLSLEHIYRWIETVFPWFAHEDNCGWRNSVRHTLSIHKLFEKVERTELHPPGKGGIWQIADGEECHWGEGTSFTKAFPVGHFHRGKCKQVSWEEGKSGRGKGKKKRLSDSSEDGKSAKSESTTPLVPRSPAKIERPVAPRRMSSGTTAVSSSLPVTPHLETTPTLPSITELTNFSYSPPAYTFPERPLAHGQTHSYEEEHQAKRPRLSSESLPPISLKSRNSQGDIVLPPIAAMEHLPPRYSATNVDSFEAEVAFASRYRRIPAKQTSYERYSSSFESESLPGSSPESRKFQDYGYGNDKAAKWRNRVEVVEVNDRNDEEAIRRTPWNGFKFWVP